ncbi:unnamed protein product [Allacma fusca]|uniref:Sepiapterin reductase n=1 Tax=Allacma fusca TaxID=39272 RepID=A0A8J2JT36_9HEXA|nr:unnamed protein product [Allacma fusca]
MLDLAVFLIIARNQANLNETKSLMEKVAPEVQVQTASLDLSNPNEGDFLKAIQSAATVNGNDSSAFQHAILVHNAASIGDVKLLLSQYDNLEYLQKYYNLNVISTVLLNSFFLKVFHDSSKQRSIIQVTSLVSKVPVKTLGIYASAKAGRNVLMRVLAMEEKNLTTLSWAPGVVSTDMYSECERSFDQDVVNFFLSMRELGNLVTAEMSASKLVKVLQDGSFENGSFVDYYELPEQYHPTLKDVVL